MPINIIYQVVDQIPCGKVATYGQIAQLAGLGRGARQVGRVLKHLPNQTRLPWHRVVNSRGTLSMPADSPEYLQQWEKLQQEGVIFSNGRIDLRVFGWVPV